MVEAFKDQFAPYAGYAGIADWSRPFPGTLFRLPLRTPAQAESSLLSRRALALPEALALLQALQGEASAMLLFLKVRALPRNETSRHASTAAVVIDVVIDLSTAAAVPFSHPSRTSKTSRFAIGPRARPRRCACLRAPSATPRRNCASSGPSQGPRPRAAAVAAAVAAAAA